jgi:hypothetical protein
MGYDMGPMTPSPDIRLSSQSEQVERMVEWFYANFEDPADNMPWDEGEYVYIWGGPYYASEELDAVFHGQVPTEVIDLAVREIEREGFDWAPSESRLVEKEFDEDALYATPQFISGHEGSLWNCNPDGAAVVYGRAREWPSYCQMIVPGTRRMGEETAFSVTGRLAMTRACSTHL